MITPTFSVDQDDNFIKISIHVPYVKSQDVEFYIENNEFKFCLHPYYLRLRFPGNIVEDDRAEASYDISKGDINVKLGKENPGEYFPDLDLLTKLLARRENTRDQEKRQFSKTLIEVVENKREHDDNDVESQMKQRLSEFDEGKQVSFKKLIDNNVNFYSAFLYLLIALDFDWEIEQEIPKQPELLITARYGFNGQYNRYFTHVQETCNEINEIKDPESSTFESRHRDRIEAEDLKFDEEYYMGDYTFDEEIKRVMNYKTVWWKLLRRIQTTKEESNSSIIDSSNGDFSKSNPSNSKIENDVTSKQNQQSNCATFSLKNFLPFTKREQEIMLNLPNKEYLLDDEKSIYLGLIDLLFAYSYNHRVTESENTVESVWTVGKLSSTISCLEHFTTLKSVITASYRRALSYPLYRNYELCEKILQDVYVILKLGRRAILKCLMELKELFDHHDVYYVYSKIWIDDYCVWCMKASDSIIRSLAHQIHHFKLPKSEIGWNLEELAQLVKEIEDEDVI
ncbi:901_t:CDS:2 [Ambispora leptoticha]|uniref:901_t:CDS:1 n=1 Tax=Ambispora leptoticha TaxID=144679 RepID=A0A9N8ZTW8_9GLOM|nr:901_t:CDS:2 [Ambispora leptoticha]